MVSTKSCATGEIMPERQDTKNTTDQARSGGRQTQETDRPGQGTSAATNPGSGAGISDAPENAEGRYADEMKQREIARNSKHPGNPADEWSPGTHQPNT